MSADCGRRNHLPVVIDQHSYFHGTRGMSSSGQRRISGFRQRYGVTFVETFYERVGVAAKRVNTCPNDRFAALPRFGHHLVYFVWLLIIGLRRGRSGLMICRGRVRRLIRWFQSLLASGNAGAKNERECEKCDYLLSHPLSF